MKTKEEIEKELFDLLDELLSYNHQGGSIIGLEYDEDKQECTIKMTVFIDEDGYVGFQSY